MDIKIIGAKEHNLKNITLNIPRNRLVVITGVSGSGKSSLAFDTIFAEAQREYVESMSTYSRRSLPKMGRANVDSIEGLSPCIVIDQHPLARNPRSTVGTVTEIYTYLRLLYSRLGKSNLSAGDFSFNTSSGACETCRGLGTEFAPDLDKLIDWNISLNLGAIRHRNWAVKSRNWNIVNALNLFDMNKNLADYSQEELDTLLYSSAKEFQNRAPGYIQNFTFEGIITRIMRGRRDARGLDGNSYSDQFFDLKTCSECGGARINARARSVKLNDRSIADLVTIEINDLIKLIGEFHGPIASSIVPYITEMLGELVNLGLGYLTLSRSVDTLSGGEAQKVKLARQLGSSLTELIYVLDEPTIGLHARDVDHIIRVLKQLTHKPNTVIVVEHDKSVMLNADFVVDLGPGPGTEGGEIMAAGTPAEIISAGTLTGRYLSGEKNIPVAPHKRQPTEFFTIKNASHHNLQKINVRIPKYVFNCITGVSGSGKSSLLEIFLKEYPKAVIVDQSPAGTMPTSIPATYVDAFGRIRKLFAQISGKSESFFSFNSKGACPTCGGLGFTRTDLHFLGELQQVCSECLGKRYLENILQFKLEGKSIADVLDMTIAEATKFFEKDKFIDTKLQLLIDVGLGYLRMGQSLDTLSGGEAQRVKLAKYLSTKGDIYILDEPTRGLHPSDTDRLLQVLERLVDIGNTLIVVEHDLNVIKNADWVIDLGPEGGKKGGRIVAEGSPTAIISAPESITGQYLAPLLANK
jgi:excinuclease UvrABC ATPase subunit